MNIYDMINNAEKTGDLNAKTFLEKILKTAETHHISINNAVKLLMSSETNRYRRNILQLVKRFYPDNGENNQKNNQEKLINISKLTIRPPEKIRMYY